MYRARGLIRDAADGAKIDIGVVETIGSMDNLERPWSRRGWRAADVQADAYQLRRQDAASQNLSIEEPVVL